MKQEQVKHVHQSIVFSSVSLHIASHLTGNILFRSSKTNTSMGNEIGQVVKFTCQEGFEFLGILNNNKSEISY